MINRVIAFVAFGCLAAFLAVFVFKMRNEYDLYIFLAVGVLLAGFDFLHALFLKRTK